MRWSSVPPSTSKYPVGMASSPRAFTVGAEGDVVPDEQLRIAAADARGRGRISMPAQLGGASGKSTTGRSLRFTRFTQASNPWW